jgi:hypothetical protein
MFFSISTEIDKKFPNNFQFDHLWFNCDNGWQQTDSTFYKGYDDNYCKIIFDQHGAEIDHSQPRSFPLWHRAGLITNLDCSLCPVWADDAAHIDNCGNVTLSKQSIDLSVAPSALTISQAQCSIRQRLDRKLMSTPEHMKLYCSGGVDTLLIYSMLSDFDLLTEEHYALDQFTTENQTTLEKFWAYKQIHHWTEPAWLATGSHGDEYFLRGPAVISMLTAWHNINFFQLLSANPTSYHYHHFNRYKELWKDAWNNRHQLQHDYPTIDLLNKQILNILINDHQHWHLGNTLTWTPFKDIEIAKILLQCPIEDLLPQFLDARLTKDLIIDYKPDIIDYLSQYKNYNNKENLYKLSEYYKKNSKLG